jgi:hypothetical protein
VTSRETGSYRIGQARFRDSASELARLEQRLDAGEESFEGTYTFLVVSGAIR